MDNRLTVVASAMLLPVALAVQGCGPTMEWSPNGRLVAVVEGARPDQTALHLYDATSGERITVPDGTDTATLSWSPDGTWLAFDRFGPNQGVYLYRTADGRTRRLAPGVSGPLVWREDSSRLLAFRDAQRAVCLTVPDGSVTWEAELPPEAAASGAPIEGQWVDDTDTVVLLSSNDIWMIEAAEPVRVSTTGDVIGFRVLPGGKDLIWARKGRDPRSHLLSVFRMSLKERSASRIPFPARVPVINPVPARSPASVERAVFSPDASCLAVLSVYKHGARRQEARLFLVGLEGRVAHDLGALVTARSDSLTVAGLPFAFSHDGRRLAFMRAAPGELVICNSDGSGRQVLRGRL